ncbi:MAG: hypothetical protein CL424_05925 [Acidimicrobiaceae bacterium]|nr:hypothetical protein [Acidimicrobiaceae bacterium]
MADRMIAPVGAAAGARTNHATSYRCTCPVAERLGTVGRRSVAPDGPIDSRVSAMSGAVVSA